MKFVDDDDEPKISLQNWQNEQNKPVHTVEPSCDRPPPFLCNSSSTFFWQK